jgi:hypothetical protein
VRSARNPGHCRAVCGCWPAVTPPGLLARAGFDLMMGFSRRRAANDRRGFHEGSCRHAGVLRFRCRSGPLCSVSGQPTSTCVLTVPATERSSSNRGRPAGQRQEGEVLLTLTRLTTRSRRRPFERLLLRPVGPSTRQHLQQTRGCHRLRSSDSRKADSATVGVSGARGTRLRRPI